MTGIITTIAGTGSTTYSGDNGQATSAAVFFPRGVNIDSSGNVYIADSDNQRIRKVISTGIITTIAGTGTASYSGDTGQATSAALNYPSGVAVDPSGMAIIFYQYLERISNLFDIGNIFIADTNNHRIRKVAFFTTIITTIAGTGASGYSGDNGAATSATLTFPNGVALDSTGKIFPLF